MKIKYGIRRPDVWIVHACIVKPLQIIQNAAPHLIFDQTNRTIQTSGSIFYFHDYLYTNMY